MNKKSNKLIQLSVIIFLSLVILSPQTYSQLAYGHDKFLGNAGDGPYEANFSLWNQLTPGNAGKWGSIEISRDQYSWGVDRAYNYAKERGIPFKFHTLIWGQQQPSWIPGNLSLEEQAEEVEEWIRLVGERYPDIDFVDVVNEPLPNHAPAQYREALGGAGQTGWDWVIKAFELARQYIPNAKLHINDYNIINDNNNTTRYIEIINLLKERNLIDGIGVQGHNTELQGASVTTLENNLDRLAATGLPIYITELDIAPTNPIVDDSAQLAEYQRIFPVLWEHPGVKGITLWGYLEGQVWRVATYLIRSNGSERPALQWLRDYLTLPGTFRSFQSGNWNDVNTWEQYNGSEWVHPTPGIPQTNDNIISVLDGHTITVTTSNSIDQLIVSSEGTLVINPGVTITVKNGDGIDLLVSGTIRNFGNITKDVLSEIKFADGGLYCHEQNGGIIPTAIWDEGSTCQFDSVTTTSPSNGNQNFYNVIWNCPGQSSNLHLGWNGNTIGGDITVISTGSGRWQMCGPSDGSTATVTINGDIIQSGGQFTTNGTGNGNTTVIINHNGDINVSGGNFSVSRGSQGGTGTAVWKILNGNFTMMNATTQNSNSSGAKFVFSRKGVQNLTLGEGNTLTSLPIEVDSGTTLRMGTSVLSGSGIFNLNPGATLETALAGGIDSTLVNSGTKSLSKQANYSFNSTEAQVTGTQMPDTVNDLIINSSTSVTLSNNVVVNGTLEMKKAGFSLGGKVLLYGQNGTLKYSGTTPQTTNDEEFPETLGPKNLTAANSSSSGLTLHASRIIQGNVELAGKLRLGDYNLTAGSASSVGLTRYAITNGTGSLRLSSVGLTEMLFPVGTNISYAPVWITNSGTSDIVAVSLSEDNDPAPEGGRVKVKWNIGEETNGGGNYTLKFGWVSTLEDAAFRSDRLNNAYIFNLTDTTEAGAGGYERQFITQPYTVSRGNITTLGPFAVGKFIPVTEVKEKEEVLPKQFSLSQNFPNPFNPSTTIKYTLDKPSRAKVIIYNVLGVKVKTLVDSYQNAGEHSIDWNARDENNNQLPSGVYFYSLETGDKKLQKKMILIR